MNELSNKQRKEVYSIALELIKSNYTKFICFAISIALVRLDIHGINYLDSFPELLSQRPNSKTLMEPWWDAKDKVIRINCLINCINQTEQ